MSAGPVPRLAGLAAAAALFHVVLVLPDRLNAVTPQALTLFPLELPVLLAGLAVLRPHGWAAAVLRAALVAWLASSVALRLTDMGMRSAYNRPFNPAIDLHLIPAGMNLLTTSVGAVAAWAALALVVAALAVLAAALWWATGRWAGLAPRGVPRRLAGGAAFIAALVAAGEAGHRFGAWTAPLRPPGDPFALCSTVTQTARMVTTLDRMADFRRAAREDPFADAGAVLDRAHGRDILIVFVESYGRSSFDVPLYAPTHTGTLRDGEAALAARGLAMRSGWLTAPMVGGQSWLSHATLGTGLWVSDQPRYAAALASRRQWLFHLGQGAGFHTAAVMPAITLAWPEAEKMGFDTILPAAELGYSGPRFNWATMPDQFTLDALDRLVRDRVDGPVMAQVALVSSHAPWVPVPDMIDWDALGDGTVFAPQAARGDPPEVVWRDRDRVRDQYRLAIDYSLTAVLDYAARQDEAALMVVLGDHQSAPMISQSDSFDVPVHVIGPPDVVAQFDAWGWTPGLVPDAKLSSWPMDAFRDRFLSVLSSGAPAQAAGLRP
ncbi:sulfatase-like hydrolase/transferase [Meridianimarinicoccus sp. RP-17]|uniref:sulfatase-like hydrolase/transferase n=1 Tax=Meridianimarinicoccus zhengii TaxID=2056810 RepID=UPI000DAE4F15|nr:sulfatase-like hydrolase/transferase [Phycocomes zhengii]